MIRPVVIGQRRVGPDHPCLVIAEAGVNHNGSLEMALRLVDAAADAGADIVKFQTFKSEEVISPVAPKADYQCKEHGSIGFATRDGEEARVAGGCVWPDRALLPAAWHRVHVYPI